MSRILLSLVNAYPNKGGEPFQMNQADGELEAQGLAAFVSGYDG